jgi:prepilin-type N-terminal cleavage/methylation domain-containing protein
MLQKIKNQEGFTLIELLIVIVILGILASTTISKIVNQTSKARDAAKITELSSYQTPIEVYYVKNEEYPDFSPDRNEDYNINLTGLLELNELAGAEEKQYLYCATNNNQTFPGTEHSFILAVLLENEDSVGDNG